MATKILFSKIVTGLFYALCATLIITQNAFSDEPGFATFNGNHPFGNLKNTPQFGNIIFAAQPDKETIDMLKEQGIKMVVNIRGFKENPGFNERKAVEDAGISYIQIPYMNKRDMSNEALTEMWDIMAMANKNGAKVLFHCGHGQRVGSALGAILYRDYGYSREEADEIAVKAGLTSRTLKKLHDIFMETLKPNME